ncbi:Protein quaking-B [Varanus komodoensis]|nr:Protein quaking-B [Varanus komodoensis]
MVGEMETKEKPKPSPDYLMQLMNDKKLMSSLPNFCGIFNHLERLLDEGQKREVSAEVLVFEGKERMKSLFVV